MRNNRPWTTEEVDMLKLLLADGTSIMAISNRLERTIGSILAKVSDLRLKVQERRGASDR